MTSPASSAVQSAAPEETPTPESQGVQARARDSVPTALPLTPVLPPGGEPEHLLPEQAREALRKILGAFTIPKGTDVLRASGLHAAHARHKEAAAQWEAAVMRVPRQAWGYLHLLLKACIGVLDWVTESPARTIAAVIVTVAATHWL